MSESDIDMDRAMQGIDDADSHVPEITWTNCADAMPPEGYKIDVIVRSLVTKESKIISTRVAHLLMPTGNSGAEWTPYTPEKWKELNK